MDPATYEVLARFDMPSEFIITNEISNTYGYVPLLKNTTSSYRSLFFMSFYVEGCQLKLLKKLMTNKSIRSKLNEKVKMTIFIKHLLTHYEKFKEIRQSIRLLINSYKTKSARK